ncbi:uncharacterized protein IUM83_19627 [Phytophthora cinnamomi]|uniref:uncharacterized protein n=1 Tax=Phytophthora cinnamomi TaxID=4785 RepID=UPI003559E213|nr:hypothetical protein IUM83_19627 [Phytophthora cinnamomi]
MANNTTPRNANAYLTAEESTHDWKSRSKQRRQSSRSHSTRFVPRHFVAGDVGYLWLAKVGTLTCTHRVTS